MRARRQNRRRSWSRALEVALAAAIAASTVGCGARTLYQWGSYEDSLLKRYATGDADGARKSVEDTIEAAEGDARRVPPGVYADYGFLLFQHGDRERAVQYFQKEADAFPESTVLMNKLIARIRDPERRTPPPGADTDEHSAP